MSAMRNLHRDLTVLFRSSKWRKSFDGGSNGDANYLELALASGRMGIWRWDVPSGIYVMHKSMAALCGLKGTTAMSIQDFYGLVHWLDRTDLKEAFERSAREESEYVLDFRVVWPDGTQRWISQRWQSYTDPDAQSHCITGACTEITDRKASEQQVAASLKEKQVLLQEIHHRVNNNLNLVTGLLSIESECVKDHPALLRVLTDTCARVHAIAGLHENLYSSLDMKNIHFGRYMERIVRHLSAVYNVSNANLQLRTEVADLTLGMDHALSLGLILNELVCNAFKHAFPGQRIGKVEIVLRYVSSGNGPPAEGELMVKDNGCGMSGDLAAHASTGTRIVALLVQQLHGTIMLNRDRGTEAIVRFPLNEQDASSGGNF